MNIKAIKTLFTQATFVMALCACYVPQVMSKPARVARDTNTPEEQENTTTQCGDVTPDKLNIPQTELYPHTDRFIMYPFLQPGKEYFQPAEEPRCPIGVQFPADQINMIGNCPYDFIDNVNPSRLPAVIKEARCLCRHGLYLDDRAPREDTVCREIMHPMKVLIQDGCEDGYFSYRFEEIDVAVGCVQVIG